jgi:polysaccharide biosynthesis/export protein
MLILTFIIALQSAPPATQTAPPATQTAPPATQTVPPTTQTPPPATQTLPPTTQTPPATQTLPPATQTAPPAAVDPAQYIVGPNDVLAVTVFNQPQLSGKFVVEADGTVGFPLLGRVAAGGMSIRAVEDELRNRLAAGYVKSPNVSVTIEQYRSQQVFVMGEVRQPGSLQFTGSMTLIEALARAGSTTDRAGSDVVVIRSRTGAPPPSVPASGVAPDAETVRVSLHDLQTGALSDNLALRPGDTVFVPRAQTVFVSGQVKTAGEYVLRSGMTVRQALVLAGGITERGSSRRIQIIRQVDGKETTIDVDMQQRVQPGDTIVVRDRLF